LPDWIRPRPDLGKPAHIISIFLVIHQKVVTLSRVNPTRSAMTNGNFRRVSHLSWSLRLHLDRPKNGFAPCCCCEFCLGNLLPDTWCMGSGNRHNFWDDPFSFWRLRTKADDVGDRHHMHGAWNTPDLVVDPQLSRHSRGSRQCPEGFFCRHPRQTHSLPGDVLHFRGLLSRVRDRSHGLVYDCMVSALHVYGPGISNSDPPQRKVRTKGHFSDFVSDPFQVRSGCMPRLVKTRTHVPVLRRPIALPITTMTQ